MANINIQGLGGVTASPDRNTPGGDYYYHWERDGALSMYALFLTKGYSYSVSYMKSYSQWVLRAQNQNDPNGIDIRVEPKYYLPNANVYTGGWCRPQTDGPALRSYTLIQFASAALNNGDSSFVRQYLWTSSSSYNGGAIKYDLDWIANNWGANGCDLWEEVQSTDFFWGRINMRTAMILGSQFAQAMGDSNSASRYYAIGLQINATLPNHYNGQFIYESTNRQQDASVITGLNDAYMANYPDMFQPSGSAAAGTVQTLNNLFCNAFNINQYDNSRGVPGILYGRYQGDTYAGGNPWILLSNSLAELFYRGAAALLEMTDSELNEWQSNTLKDWVAALQWKISDPKSLTLYDLVQGFSSAGDAVLDRVNYHVAGAGYHLSEQLDRNTGYEVSATDLTWSYATVFKAMYYRNQVLALWNKRFPGIDLDF